MKLLVMEHKSSAEDIGLGSVYWKKLRLDSQCSNYMVGARALGHDPYGVLYDVLKKPGQEPYLATPLENRKYTKPTKAEPVARLYANQRERDETPLEYRDRILADIALRPDYYYQRGIVVRLENEERDAAFDTWQTADAIRVSRNAGVWPRNVDACSSFGRMCDYWEVCSGEVSIDDGLRFERGETHPELDNKLHLPLVTTSSARSYRACPKRYFFAYELGVRPRVLAPPLRLGRTLHAALDVWLSSGGDIEAALAAVAPKPPAPYDFDAAKAEAMLRGYDARWHGAALEVVSVEEEFVCDLVNPDTGAKSRTWHRGGRIDAIVRTAA